MHFLLELYHNCTLCAHVSNASLEAEEFSIFLRRSIIFLFLTLVLVMKCAYLDKINKIFDIKENMDSKIFIENTS